jgi:tetratricopeptide (TPR) repeat protein
MLLLRRVATGVVIAAASAVLLLSVYLLWNAPPWDYLPLQRTYTSDLDARAQVLEDKLEMYSRRVNDMETLVIILLGISGLYAIVFILTVDFNTRSVNRKVDRALENVKDQIGASLSDLRELKEETRDALRAESKDAVVRLQEVQQQAREMIQNMRAQMQSATMPVFGEADRGLEAIQRLIAALADAEPSETQKQELLHYEGALPTLELFHALQFGPQLACIYRTLARHYDRRDPARSRFYLGRAQTVAPKDFETANELATLVLDRQPPDYGQARSYFEASLAAQPDQQRAKFGLARIAQGQGDLETAVKLLESAAASQNWEKTPDPANAALVHYALACALARHGQGAPAGEQPQDFLRATRELEAAFAHPSRRLEQMLSQDTEEGGDLFVLANTPPYGNLVDDLMLNVSVGAA